MLLGQVILPFSAMAETIANRKRIEKLDGECSRATWLLPLTVVRSEREIIAEAAQPDVALVLQS
jgi:hypothetical protein